eukprot:Stramenopile-MAST_4_protein_1428
MTSFSVTASARRVGRLTFGALSPEQSAYWRDKAFCFVGLAGSKPWEDNPDEFAESCWHEHSDNFYDESEQQWNDTDPRFFSWDSWDDLEGVGADPATVTITTSDGNRQSFTDYVKEHDCKVVTSVHNLDRNKRFTRKYLSSDANLSAYFGFEHEANSTKTLGATLPDGESFDPSRVVFLIDRVYTDCTHDQTFVEGLSSFYYVCKDENKLEVDDDTWDCCHAVQSTVVFHEKGPTFMYAAASCIARWYRCMMAQKRLKWKTLCHEIRQFGMSPPIPKRHSQQANMTLSKTPGLLVHRGGGLYLEAKEAWNWNTHGVS